MKHYIAEKILITILCLKTAVLLVKNLFDRKRKVVVVATERVLSVLVFIIIVLSVLHHPNITRAATIVMPIQAYNSGEQPNLRDGQNINTPAISDTKIKEDDINERVLGTFMAFETKYSRADSCHYVRSGKCLMASGKEVYRGAVACPYFLTFGTIVRINNELYTCEDRYARRLDKARGLPTVDIFVESNPVGMKKVAVDIVSIPNTDQ